jgi:hypothetical protein
MGITLDKAKDIDGDKIIIEGGTDGTSIGNVNDRLKVTTAAGGGGSMGAWNSKLRYEDMNDIARDASVSATFTTLYTYTGSGVFAGFNIQCESLDETNTSKSWYIRLIIDGEDIFFGSGGAMIADFADNDLYDVANNGDQSMATALGFRIQDKTLWYEDLIEYSTSVEIQIRKANNNKKYKAGYVKLSKET